MKPRCYKADVSVLPNHNRGVISGARHSPFNFHRLFSIEINCVFHGVRKEVEKRVVRDFHNSVFFFAELNGYTELLCLLLVNSETGCTLPWNRETEEKV